MPETVMPETVVPGRGVLIVGGGPTGLSAALHLLDAGIDVRIVERLAESSPHSKAFGVNPRTLSLLEPTGVTERLLARGYRMRAINAWKGGRRLFRIDLSRVDHRYPFMLVHSQAETEALLREALTARGAELEREVTLTRLTLEGGRARATLTHGDGEEEQLVPDVVLGADGAGSTVRKSLGIPFSGSRFDEPWKLYDIELDTPLERDEAHIFLLEAGGMFVVRLDDVSWRVISNAPDPLERLPRGTVPGEIAWESDFGISSLLVDRLHEGNVYLAGDAAHIHSGLGARGMNLGIEDAYVFSQLVVQGRLEHYERLRHPTDAAVVRQTERMTEIPRGKRPFARVARALIPAVAPLLPLAQKRIATWLLGLEHEVDLGAAAG